MEPLYVFWLLAQPQLQLLLLVQSQNKTSIVKGRCDLADMNISPERRDLRMHSVNDELMLQESSHKN